MSQRPTGPACGNNPNYRMSDGDRQAVEDFKAYLAARALRDRIAALFRHPPGEERLGDATPGEIADAVLAVLPAPVDRAAVLNEAADHLARQADELWAPGTRAHTVMQADVAELRRMAAEAQPTPDLAAADNPTQLRWGLNDVLWGDDDTVTVLLSGPGGEPYWLELDPERAAVLREDLAGPEAQTTQPQQDGEA